MNRVYDKNQSTFLSDASPSFKSRIYSDETTRAIDNVIRGLVKHALEKAIRVLNENKEILLKSVALLLEKETLTEDELTPLYLNVKSDNSKHETEV